MKLSTFYTSWHKLRWLFCEGPERNRRALLSELSGFFLLNVSLFFFFFIYFHSIKHWDFLNCRKLHWGLRKLRNECSLEVSRKSGAESIDLTLIRLHEALTEWRNSSEQFFFLLNETTTGWIDTGALCYLATLGDLFVFLVVIRQWKVVCCVMFLLISVPKVQIFEISQLLNLKWAKNCSLVSDHKSNFLWISSFPRQFQVNFYVFLILTCRTVI